MRRKIVTLCGSARFWDEMLIVQERLALEKGWVVIGIVPRTPGRSYSPQEIELLGALHREKIDLSDAIFVVNPGGYIGEATKGEIAYAQKLGKEIYYLQEPEVRA